MPYITIPSTDKAPKACSDHKEPQVNGRFLSYEVTETEHNFWKGLSNKERSNLRARSLDKCFYEVLKEEMNKTPRMFH